MASGETKIVDPNGDLLLLLDPVKPVHVEQPAKVQDDDVDMQSTTSEVSTPWTHDEIQDPDPPSEPAPYNCRILVSSKHMTLASPVFMAMLNGNFQEGVLLKAHGKLELPLPDDNCDAMLIISNIIHNRAKLAPPEMDVATLTAVAVLVDKYRIHDVVYMFVPIWKQMFRPANTKFFENGKDVLKDRLCWICIAWVFNMDEEFKQASKHLQRVCFVRVAKTLEFFKLDTLPIPGHVIAAIDTSRFKALRKAFRYLETTISEYQGSTTVCPKTKALVDCFNPHTSETSTCTIDQQNNLCDSLVIGSLIKSATKQGIYPLPPAPYDKVSFEFLLNKIDSLDIYSYCFKDEKSGGMNRTDAHGVKDKLQDSLKDVQDTLQGLELSELKDSS